jgi:RHS repeat-associated protein
VFVYDEEGRLIGEYDNLGRARNEHVWLADRPVALIVYTYSGTSTTPLTTTYYSVEADHLGTPRLITDSTQAQRWTWHSAPYGDTLPNEKPGTAAALIYNLRFPGQYFDKETNLHYNWHRDYESTTGRYIESDPIGLAGGINTYAYVGGEPIRYVDALGLDRWGDARLPVEFCVRNPSRAQPVPHVFTCVSGDCKGFYPSSSNAASSWYSSFGEVRRDTPSDPNTTCKVIDSPQPCQGNEFAECVRNRISSPWGLRYGMFGYTCSDFAQDAIRECSQACQRQ